MGKDRKVFATNIISVQSHGGMKDDICVFVQSGVLGVWG